MRAASTDQRDQPVTVALVEDHVALRKGMELLLGRHGCVIVGTAGDGPDAYELIRRTRPDVAVVDVNLPGETGIELTRRLLAEESRTAILLFTGEDDPQTLSDALACGARGFAFKSANPEELRGAIEAVAAGETYVDPSVSSKLGRPARSAGGVLARRERETLGLLAKGMTGEEIARQLFLAPETVRTHVRNAMRKLEAQTRAHAIVIALRTGEIDI